MEEPAFIGLEISAKCGPVRECVSLAGRQERTEASSAGHRLRTNIESSRSESVALGTRKTTPMTGTSGSKLRVAGDSWTATGMTSFDGSLRPRPT
jgi:hypothetical protein